MQTRAPGTGYCWGTAAAAMSSTPKVKWTELVSLWRLGGRAWALWELEGRGWDRTRDARPIRLPVCDLPTPRAPPQEIERLKTLVGTVGEQNLTPDAWVSRWPAPRFWRGRRSWNRACLGRAVRLQEQSSNADWVAHRQLPIARASHTAPAACTPFPSAPLRPWAAAQAPSGRRALPLALRRSRRSSPSLADFADDNCDALCKAECQAVQRALGVPHAIGRHTFD